MRLIHVDCEGHGSYGGWKPAAGLNNHEKFEFGAVEHDTGESFHGIGGTKETFEAFAAWLEQWTQPDKPGRGTVRVVFVSDNVAYDWQFINYYFHLHLGYNPFGHSGRRIGDFAAGLVGDFYARQVWKALRVTPHDHNPVHDAMGNREALKRLIQLNALDKLRKGSDRWRLEDGKWKYRAKGAKVDSPDPTPIGPYRAD